MRPRIVEIALLFALLIAVVIATQVFPKRFKGQVVSTVTSGLVRDCNCKAMPILNHLKSVRW